MLYFNFFKISTENSFQHILSLKRSAFLLKGATSYQHAFSKYVMQLQILVNNRIYIFHFRHFSISQPKMVIASAYFFIMYMQEQDMNLNLPYHYLRLQSPDIQDPAAPTAPIFYVRTYWIYRAQILNINNLGPIYV